MGEADAVMHRATGLFLMFEIGSHSEGWATGREDERGSRRERDTDGWTGVAFSLPLSLSFVVS